MVMCSEGERNQESGGVAPAPCPNTYVTLGKFLDFSLSSMKLNLKLSFSSFLDVMVLSFTFDRQVSLAG